MKKRLILPMVVSGVLFVTPAQAAIGAITTADYLNVRQSPSTNSAVIDVLPKGTYVECEDAGNPDWNKIQRNGYVGYVYNAYLSADDDPVPLNARAASGMQPSVKSPEVGLAATKTPSQQDEPADVEVERLWEPADFKYQGVLNWNGWRWTWYSSHVYNNDLGIPGQHETSEGYIVDEDEYICLASVDLDKGTIVKTPLGYFGKVYDTGCPHGTLDVYTNWSVY